ncbi:MAG: GNAT family N-acetyltransferase [Candidatus Sericytochromatia bacterium]
MIEIFKIQVEDIKELQKVAKKTFYDTFHETNTEESMNKYLNTAFNEDKLREEILNPNSFFYSAKEDNKIIGYLKLNIFDAQTELKDINSIEIERIYILKDYHGKNVSNLLMTKSLELAKSKNKSFIWLGVEEKNIRAIKFYQKNGFKEFDKHIFKFGDEEQIDIMMKLTIE